MKKPSIDDIEIPAARSRKCPMCKDLGRTDPPEINDDYEVDELAGYNNILTKIYVDRRIPEIVKGVPTRKSLPIHEIVESVLEHWLGFGYDHAHMMAQAAEDKFVEIMEDSPKAYEKEFVKLIKKLEHTAKDTPPDIEDPNTIKGR